MTTIRRIYVEQFGAYWSLSPAAWRKAVTIAIAGSGFDFDKPETLGVTKSECRRIGQPRTVLKGRDEDPWSTSLAHPLKRPLDWDEDDWRDELESLEDSSA